MYITFNIVLEVRESDIHAASQEVPYCWSCGAKILGKEMG